MILAVDDEHVLLVLIEAVCEAEGFEVETFLDPEEALLRAAEVRPDLVISDVMMPGLDGFAFKEALEDLYPDRNIPFIFLSSRSSTDDLVRGLDAGAEDYLTKPIDQKLLGAKIRSLLRRTREEQTAVFHGQLSEFPLQRILGFCETQGLTGSVEFELEGVPIFLFLRQGVIDLGPLKGREEILLKISELREGKFTIRAQGGEFLLGGNPWPTSADDSYTSYRENGLTDPDTREGKLRYLLRHDRLTGLPNRLHLKEGLGNALREAREQKRHVAVLIIDLDHFRTINDGLGHAVGDLLLQRVTDRLRGCLKGEEDLYRVGGDDFVVVIPGLTDHQPALDRADCIREQLSRAFTLHERDLVTSASVGISFFPEHGTKAGTLLSRADFAMYRAKDDGRNCCRVFSDVMNEDAEYFIHLESDLRNAIGRNELELAFQPKIDLKTQLVSGFEALLRWRRPDGSSVSPDVFIPVAEKHGLMPYLDRWVLYAACRQLKMWHESGHDHLEISVNISAEHFRQADDLIDLVDEVLKSTALNPESLLLEITETALLRDVDEALRTMHEIRRLGVQFSMDDFGTGYSSLSLVKRLPFAELKVDKSFIDDIPHDHQGISIIWATLSMAQSLNMKVVAEGIERIEQAEFLQRHHCDLAQGYLFGRALPAGKISRALDEDHPLPWTL